ncbi:cupin domain-containing protein [Promicromonospora sp. NPDC050880]|uniref:cupin domain-containing protein n=1 Tax=Promicromonospora sp. NPDC050880 TaxID=3364406 RepID=UPI00378CAC76
MATPYAATAADHEMLEWLGGGMMQVLLDGTRTDGRLAMFRSAAPAGAASPAHLHTREDEIFVLLRGSAIIWVGAERFELDAGGVAFLPRGVPHAYRITAEADLLALSTPAGLEGFFRGAGRDARTPRPKGWEITPQTMGEAAAGNGQVVLGPPLCPDDLLPAYSGTPDLAPHVARADQHEILEWLGGSRIHVLLDEEHTGGRLSLFRSTDAPAGSASPVYVQHHEDEIVVMLSGSGTYWVGDHRYELSPGGVVVIPRGVPTAHRITADAETLTVTTPGGAEAFYRAAGRDVRLPRPDGWEVPFDALTRASEAAGQTILAAPLAAHEMIPEELLVR